MKLLVLFRPDTFLFSSVTGSVLCGRADEVFVFFRREERDFLFTK